ncbi:MAG: DUF1854 domain-containing protein [Ruminococcaceae bacterium]|nr:DUF1854 domain-containing protein [Oscillospiraceae bacterium]
MFGHGRPPMGGRGPHARGPVDTSTEVKRIDKTNAVFCMKNGFLSMTKKEENGEEKVYDRVFLHRAFPFELLWEYVSVLDSDQIEIGIIYKIDEFEGEEKEILVTELKRKYYEPVIKTITSLKERYGFSYWEVVCEDGRNVKFTMQDTFRNIIRVGDDRAILLDVDGNRFVIESIMGLDKKSHKKIELYM